MFSAAAALRFLFQNLNSPAQLGWPANGDDPCGQPWKGISCSGNRVTEMYSPTLFFTLYNLIITFRLWCLSLMTIICDLPVSCLILD